MTPKSNKHSSALDASASNSKVPESPIKIKVLKVLKELKVLRVLKVLKEQKVLKYSKCSKNGQRVLQECSKSAQ